MKTAINTLLRTSVATTMALACADGRTASAGEASDKCIVSLAARSEAGATAQPRSADARPCPVALISNDRMRLDV